jgi:hypothetical protein
MHHKLLATQQNKHGVLQQPAPSKALKSSAITPDPCSAGVFVGASLSGCVHLDGGAGGAIWWQPGGTHMVPVVSATDRQIRSPDNVTAKQL